MSADEESTSGPADTPMTESQSHKRKASVDGDLEKETATSPKRAKLEQPEPKAKPATTDDGQTQEPGTAPRHDDNVTDQKVSQPEETKLESKTASPPPPPPPQQQGSTSRRPSIPPTPEPTRPATGPSARKSISEQEKKRGQRLFGGLLSTLSQRTPSSAQQKKRAEMERRQHERAQQQRAEEDRRRAEKLAELQHVRKIEQVKLDGQAMQTRHRNMLAQAHSLSTHSEPKLYYLPWKLTEAQELLIKEQVSTTTRLVAREAGQFQSERKQRLSLLGVAVAEPEPEPESEPAVQIARQSPEPQRPQSSSSQSDPMVASREDHDEKVGRATATSSSEETTSNTEKTGQGHENHHDDPGYVMVENEEDTVIY